MALSNYLAQLFGILFVVVPLAFLLNGKNLKWLFSKIANEENLLCWGFAGFSAGLAIVLGHNVWVKDWPVVITILGWIALLKGLALMFTPDSIKKCCKKLENSPLLPFGLVVVIFAGLVIAYLGFTA